MNEEEFRDALAAIAGDTTPSPSAAGRVDAVVGHRLLRRRLVASAAVLAFLLGTVVVLGAGQDGRVRTVPARPTTTTTAFTGPTVVAVTERGAVRVVDARRGRTIRTLVKRAVDGGVSRSPDGATVYYADAGTGCANGTIHAVPVDGSAPPTPVVDGTTPAVSPDGHRLAYWRRQPGETGCDLDIVVRTLATGAEQRHTFPNGYFGGGHVDRIDWSPDGGRLMFTRFGASGVTILDLTPTGLVLPPPAPLPTEAALAWWARSGGAEGWLVYAVSTGSGGVPLDPPNHLALLDPTVERHSTNEYDAIVHSGDIRFVALDFDPSGTNIVWRDDRGRFGTLDSAGNTKVLGDGYVEVVW